MTSPYSPPTNLIAPKQDRWRGVCHVISACLSLILFAQAGIAVSELISHTMWFSDFLARILGTEVISVRIKVGLIFLLLSFLNVNIWLIAARRDLSARRFFQILAAVWIPIYNLFGTFAQIRAILSGYGRASASLLRWATIAQGCAIFAFAFQIVPLFYRPAMRPFNIVGGMFLLTFYLCVARLILGTMGRPPSHNYG